MVELVFLHLPKTGGSSVLETLNTVYGAQHVRHFERDECLKLNEKGLKISEVLDANIKVIHGHILYSEISDVVQRDSPKMVTFMREPNQRVISNYNWWHHRLTASSEPADPKRLNESLKVYITKPETQNKMARFLEGAPLKAFYFIGFLECFQEDLALLGEKLNWPKLPVFHEKDRRNHKKVEAHQVSWWTKRKIARLNKADWALYKKARKIFKR